MNPAIPTAIHSTHSIGKWLHAICVNAVRQTRPSTGAQRTDQRIARNAILEVKQPLGITIECLEGSVWVTLDGDARDVVLDAGQAFTVDRQQRALLQALEAALVRVIEPTCVR